MDVKIKPIVIEALYRANDVHDTLGVNGVVEIHKNQFGDTALRGDIEAEKAVFECFREAGIPIRFVSEEHGVTDITSQPKYLGVLDGIDGSGVYKRFRGTGRYGTLLGIFSSTNPAYEDYVVCGFMEHATNRLYITSKNGGSFVLTNGGATKIRCSDKTVLDEDTRIHVDGTLWWGCDEKIVRPRLNDVSLTDLHCSGAHHVDLAAGIVDGVLESTRKNNLEVMVDFGLVTEAGGVVVDSTDERINNKKYLSWEQDRHVPIIMAATPELAQQLCDEIRD